MFCCLKCPLLLLLLVCQENYNGTSSVRTFSTLVTHSSGTSNAPVTTVHTVLSDEGLFRPQPLPSCSQLQPLAWISTQAPDICWVKRQKPGSQRKAVIRKPRYTMASCVRAVPPCRDSSREGSCPLSLSIAQLTLG